MAVFEVAWATPSWVEWKCILIRRLETKLTSLFAGRTMRRLGVQLGNAPTLVGRPVVAMAPDSKIFIGCDTVLISRSTHTALGVNHPVVLRTLMPGATLRIGDNVGMSGGSICAAVSISIGDGTLLGANVVIADTDFHEPHSLARRYLPIPEPNPTDAISIGRNVFIGTNAIVLKGVRLGDHCVVGAGSVVTRSFEAGSILAGTPAKLISRLQDLVP